MYTHTVNDFIDYDGTQLRSHFIYSQSKRFGDGILIFLGKMEVTPEGHMVDLEDVRNDDGIFSPFALQFIIEHFGISLDTAVYRQRLFMSCALEILSEISETVNRLRLEGDDLVLGWGKEKKKLSVSIATKSPTSTLIHTGINIVSVPQGKVKVPTLCLADLVGHFRVNLNAFEKLSDFTKIQEIGIEIADLYKFEVEAINIAQSKVTAVP